MLLVINLIIINLTSFALYGVDKYKAIKQSRRISEKALILLAVSGGFLGALLGMYLFHHKTQKKKFTVWIPVISAVWALFIIFCLYQNYHLVVSEYEYKSDFNCRIVQISDLHNQFFGLNQARLLSKVKDCDPDIIVVTGDAVDSIHTSYNLAYDFFEGAVEIAPVYYVTGNHEVWLYGDKFDSFLDSIEALGVQFIDGRVVETEHMLIAGTYDDSHIGDYDWEEDSRLRVLLVHDPDNINNYSTAGADIVFAGHVHGGQIIIPGKGGLFSPDFTLFPEYYEGEYKQKNTTMYVSRGLGNSVLPVRINDYPEIVVVNIRQ